MLKEIKDKLKDKNTFEEFLRLAIIIIFMGIIYAFIIFLGVFLVIKFGNVKLCKSYEEECIILLGLLFLRFGDILNGE